MEPNEWAERPQYRRLTPYDRLTLNLWTRSHAEWRKCVPGDLLVEAALSAVLAGLRRCRRAEELFELHAESPRLDADFALIGSLLPELRIPDDELLWRVREAAFYVRWVELVEHSVDSDR